MKYNEFVEQLLFGSEFEGTIDGLQFRILNVIEDKTVFIIGEHTYEIDDECVLIEKVYNNMTFKELFEQNIIKIDGIY